MLDFRVIRDRFYCWAFHTYYEFAYRDVQDHNLRFALAIVASSRRVSDERIAAWWGKIKDVQREQAKIPGGQRISKGRAKPGGDKPELVLVGEDE